jgi:hypothetical protein
MGLFDQLLNAVNDPGADASPDQLSGILGAAQDLSRNFGTDPAQTQDVMSVVGNYVRSSLQQTRATQGEAQAQALVNQFSGFGANPQAVNAVLGPVLQQQVVQDLMQRTGLSPQTIQSMLPLLVPLALNLLQGGNRAQGGNPVLSSFLDGDRDGDVDLGDAMRLAGQFLNR